MVITSYYTPSILLVSASALVRWFLRLFNRRSKPRNYSSIHTQSGLVAYIPSTLKRWDGFYAPTYKKYGFIDESGNEITPPKYDKLLDFKNGFAIYKIKNKYGFINKNGNEITPPKYDYLLNFNNNIAIYKINGKYGFINKNGNEITLPKYNFLWWFSDGFYIYELNENCGLIDENGNEITKPLFVWADIKNICQHSNNLFWWGENTIFKNYSIFQNKMKIFI